MGKYDRPANLIPNIEKITATIRKIVAESKTKATKPKPLKRKSKNSS